MSKNVLQISVGNHITTAHKNQLRTMHAPKQRSKVYVTLREATQKRNRDSLEDEDEFMGFPSIPLATDGAIHISKKLMQARSPIITRSKAALPTYNSSNSES